jgi:predicted transposase YbfD/YdcC
MRKNNGDYESVSNCSLKWRHNYVLTGATTHLASKELAHHMLQIGGGDGGKQETSQLECHAQIATLDAAGSVAALGGIDEISDDEIGLDEALKVNFSSMGNRLNQQMSQDEDRNLLREIRQTRQVQEQRLGLEVVQFRCNLQLQLEALRQSAQQHWEKLEAASRRAVEACQLQETRDKRRRDMQMQNIQRQRLMEWATSVANACVMACLMAIVRVFWNILLKCTRTLGYGFIAVEVQCVWLMLPLALALSVVSLVSKWAAASIIVAMLGTLWKYIPTSHAIVTISVTSLAWVLPNLASLALLGNMKLLIGVWVICLVCPPALLLCWFGN